MANTVDVHDHADLINLDAAAHLQASSEARRIAITHVMAVKDLLLQAGVDADPAEITAFAVRLYGAAFTNALKEPQQQTDLPFDASDNPTH
jgi:hypothetical protein